LEDAENIAHRIGQIVSFAHRSTTGTSIFSTLYILANNLVFELKKLYKTLAAFMIEIANFSIKTFCCCSKKWNDLRSPNGI
jgi:hypothetical protein